MSRPTTTIETPIGKAQVEIKQWITGREREKIDGATYSSVQVKPKVQGKETSVDVQQVDVENMIRLMKHRSIEAFVVSVNGSTEKILDTVLDMHEKDTEFIVQQIDEIAKKNAVPTT